LAHCAQPLDDPTVPIFFPERIFRRRDAIQGPTGGSSCKSVVFVKAAVSPEGRRNGSSRIFLVRYVAALPDFKLEFNCDHVPYIPGG
jgi:hypothetical protein